MAWAVPPPGLAYGPLEVIVGWGRAWKGFMSGWDRKCWLAGWWVPQAQVLTQEKAQPARPGLSLGGTS